MGRTKRKVNDAPNVLVIPRKLKNGITSFLIKYKDETGNWVRESCKDESGDLLHMVDKSTPYASDINREVKMQLQAIRANKLLELTTAKERKPQRFKSIPANDLVALYVDYKKSIGYKAMNCIMHFQKLINGFDGVMPAGSIDENYVLRFQNWMKEQGYKNNTIYTNMLQLSAMLNWANGKYVSLSDNPMAGMKGKRIKQEDKHLVFLTADELKAIEQTDVKNTELKRMFLAGCYCGLRFSDLQNLTWCNVKDNGTTQYIEITMKKTSMPVRIPLNTKARLYMGERGRNDEKVFAPTYMVEVQRFVNKELRPVVGGKQITFHTSRHTFAVLMLQRGVSIYAIKELLGHTDIKTTIKYLALLDEDKQKAVNVLNDL